MMKMDGIDGREETDKGYEGSHPRACQARAARRADLARRKKIISVECESGEIQLLRNSIFHSLGAFQE